MGSLESRTYLVIPKSNMPWFVGMFIPIHLLLCCIHPKCSLSITILSLSFSSLYLLSLLIVVQLQKTFLGWESVWIVRHTLLRSPRTCCPVTQMCWMGCHGWSVRISTCNPQILALWSRWQVYICSGDHLEDAWSVVAFRTETEVEDVVFLYG